MAAMTVLMAQLTDGGPFATAKFLRLRAAGVELAADRAARQARHLALERHLRAPLVRIGLGLRREVGIPETVTRLGLARAEFDRVAELAASDICAGTNPVPVDAGSLRSILDAAA
jgi:alcohol dehydrogenase class IV